MAWSDVYLTSYSDSYGAVSRTDTYETTYGSRYGTQFGPAPLDVRAELDLSGAWADITGDVYQRDAQQAVTITRGRADELSSCNPGTLAMELNNRSGKYSPRNPLGPYYGQFGRNTPVRVSVPAMEAFLRLENDQQSGAQCPDSAALDITGAIDVRADVDLTDWRPCVLASKWTVTTGSVVSGGATVGATCNQACYPGSGSQIAAGKILDGFVGRPLAETAQKVFFTSGSTATFPSSVLAKDKGLLDAKVLLWLCYKPAVNGSDLSALTTSISAYLAYAASAGAPQPKVVLWQEPQNSSNGLTAATYKQCMQNYYSHIKALAGSPAVVYCSASHLGETGVRAWYPGDSLCDEVSQDLYGYTWKHGTTLATLESIANAASPQKPVSHSEFGTALSQSQANSMSQADVEDFFAYITGVFAARSAAGLPNGEIMWFNGLAGADWNTIQAGDFRGPLLSGLYDALQPSSGGVSSNERSWALVLNGDGTISFWWTTDGTYATLNVATSTAPVPLGRVTIRARGQASGGASMTFYTAPGGHASGTGTSAPWAQLGSAISLSSLHVFSSSAPLSVGYNPAVTSDNAAYGGPAGQVFGFSLRSFAGTYSDTYSDLYGVSLGGTAVADAAFTSRQPGATAWADALGNAWTLTGTAEISQRSYRFHGEMSALLVQWDNSGRDVYAPVQAGGLLRRLSQGQQPPVASAFKRAVLGLQGALAPEAYWPMEDASGAKTAGPAIGPAPMTGTNPPSFAADTSFACSAALPAFAFSELTGSVQPYAGATAAVVRFPMKVPASPSIADDTIICRINLTGSAGDVTLKWKTGGQLRFTGYGSAGGGGFLWDTGASGLFAVDGEELLVSIELTPSGSKLAWQLAVLAAGSSTPVTVSGTVNSASPGNVTVVHLGDTKTTLGGTVLGHCFVQSAYEPVTDFAAALAAHAGETCAQRFARLCGENGIAARVYGPPELDVAMGPQAPDTLVNLLQLCEATGRGLLNEPRQSLSLGYRTVRSLCSQAPQVTADYSLGQLGDGQGTGLVPVQDDQHTVNDVTVTSGTGGSYRAVLDDGSAMSVSPPPAGAGDYGNSYTVNTGDDSQLAGIAGWLLHLGTVAEERYPSIPFHLARAAAASIFFAVQEADIGDLAQIVNTPAFLPPGPVSQLVYGTTEVLGGWQYRVAFNAVPASPYEAGIYGDPVLGRMDTDGSALDADIGTGDTVFVVDTTGPSGITWTTDAAQLPFGVLCGGEQMTVTAIIGPPINFLSGDNATFDASTGNWAAVTNCTVAQTTAAAHSGAGSLLMATVAANTMEAASCTAGNILAQGLAVSPGDTVMCSAWLRAQTNPDQCSAQIDWYDNSGTFLSSSTGPGLFDKVGTWTQVSAQFNTPASAAFCRAGVTVLAQFGDPVPNGHYVDDVFFGNITASGTPQQQFTVIRSVNGVVKAHSAGDAVALAHPAIIALA